MATRLVSATARRTTSRGMATHKGNHIPFLNLREAKQDMAPPGGYPPVDWNKRNPMTRGPPGWIIFSVGGALMLWGYFRIAAGNQERNRDKRDKRNARMCMVPYLQAEEDVRTHKAIQAELEEEATLMKGVKGWKVGESVYNSKKYWMPPTDVTRARQGFSVQVTD